MRFWDRLYLTLVDQTRRFVRGDKRGAIPAHLALILERLELDLSAWMDLMQGLGFSRFGLWLDRRPGAGGPAPWGALDCRSHARALSRSGADFGCVSENTL